MSMLSTISSSTRHPSSSSSSSSVLVTSSSLSSSSSSLDDDSSIRAHYNYCIVSISNAVTWKYILFASLTLSLLLTPISIGIIQDVDYNNDPITILLLLCDIVILLDVCFTSTSNHKTRRGGGGRSSSSKVYSVNYNIDDQPRHSENPHSSSQTHSMIIAQRIIRFINLESFIQMARLFPLYAKPIAFLASDSKNLALYSIPSLINVMYIGTAFKHLSKGKKGELSIVLFTLYIILYVSLMACIWFYASCTLTSDQLDCIQQDTWISTDHDIDLSSKTSRYFRSLHYITQTFFTVGFGDTKPLRNSEVVLNLFMIQNAFLFVAYLFSSIIAYISSIEVIGKTFREKLSKLKQFLQVRGVSEQFQEEVRHFFDFLYSRQYGILEDEFLSKLPKSIRSNIMLQVGQQLRSVPFFKDQDPIFLNLCISKLDFRTYIPKTIMYTGDDLTNRELILVRNGRVDIISHKQGLKSKPPRDGQTNEMVLLTLLQGDSFGDYNLIFDPNVVDQDMSDLNSNFSLITSAFTEALVLTRQKLVEAIEEYLIATRRFKGEISSMETLEQHFFADVDQLKHMKYTTESYHEFQKKLIKAHDTIENSSKNKKLMGMMEALEQKDDSIVILPSSKIRLIWDVLCTLGIIYVAIVAPLRLQIRWNQDHQWAPSLSIDYFFDVVMLFDIVLRAKFFAFEKFENNTETIVKDAHEILKRFYTSPGSYVRMLTVIPFDVIVVGGYRHITLTLLRMVKIGRILLLPQYLVDIQSFLETKLKLNISSEGAKVLHIFLAIVIFITWTSVAWSLLHFDGETGSLLDSFYFCFTVMTTTGFGDIIPYSTADTIYTIFVSDTLGTTVYNTIIAFFVSYVRNADDSEENIDHRRVVSKSFLSYISKDLKITTTNADDSHYERSTTISAEARAGGSIIIPQVAALEYFDYIENERNGINENEFMASSLPRHVRDKFYLELLYESLSKVDVFHQIPSALMREIMRNMECINMRPKEIISSLELLGLCFINAGSIGTSSKRDRRVLQKGRGCIFNEKALFDQTSVNGFQIKALVNTEIWYLSKVNFDRMIKQSLLRGDHIKSMKLAIDNGAKEKSAVADIKAIMKVKVAKAARNWFIYPRSSLFFAFWNGLLVMITLYNIFILPLRVAFFGQYKFTVEIFCFDFIGDLVFVVDIILNAFFVMFSDKNHQKVMDHWLIFRNYRSKPKFWFHLLASVPTDLFVLCGNVRYLDGVQTLSLLRFNRIIRLADMNELSNHLYSFSWSNTLIQFQSEVSNFLTRNFLQYFNDRVCSFGHKRNNEDLSFSNRDNKSVSKNVFRVFTLVVVLFLTAHIIGCIFFMIANISHLQGDSNNWADALGILSECTLGSHTGDTSSCDDTDHGQLLYQQYVPSVYWAMTVLTTTGYGDIVPVSDNEKGFTILVFIVVTIICAYVMMYSEEIVALLDVTSSIKSRRENKVQSFLSRELSSREDAVSEESVTALVSKYFHRLWSIQKGASPSEIKAFLCPRIYSRSIQQATERSLDNIFYLKKAPHAFRSKLCSKMTMNIYVAGEYIFHRNELSRKLFILFDGEVSLVDEESAKHQAEEDDCHRFSYTKKGSQKFSRLKTSTSTTSTSRSATSSLVETSEHLLSRTARLTRNFFHRATNPSATRTFSTVSFIKPSTQGNTPKTISRIIEGSLGEAEFFCQRIYSCSAKASKDCCIFEIDYESFISLLRDCKNEDAFSVMLRQERELLMKESTATLLKKFRCNLSNSKMSKMMKHSDVVAKKQFIIVPGSYLHVSLTAASHLITVAMCITVPYYIAFSFEVKGHSLTEDVGFICFDSVCSLFFALLMVLSFKFIAFEQDGKLVSESSRIADQYYNSNFFIHLICFLPIPLLIYTGTQHRIWYAWSRLQYMVQLRNTQSVFQSIVSTLQSYGVRINSSYQKVVGITLIVWYLAHLTTCLLCYLGYQDDSWIQKNGFQEEGGGHIYLRAYFWSFYTISTVGYGTVPLANDRERLLAIIVMICGAILCAGVTSVIGNIIAESTKTSSGLRRLLQGTLLFCRCNEISPSIQGQVSSFYDYLHRELNDQRDEDDFKLLSPSLQCRLIVALTQESLASVSFIYPKDLNTGFICSAAHHMVPYLATPREVFAVNCKAVLDDKVHTYHWLEGDYFFLRRGKVHTLTHSSSTENSNQTKEKHLILPGSNVIPTPKCQAPTASDTQLTLFICLSKAVINAPYAQEMVNKSNKALCHVEISCGDVKRISKVSGTKSDQDSASSSTYAWDEFYFFPFRQRRKFIDINIFNTDTNIFSSCRLNLAEFLPTPSDNTDINLHSSKLFDIVEEDTGHGTEPTVPDKKKRSGNVSVPLWRESKVIGSIDLVINFLADDDKDDVDMSEDSFDSDNEGKEDNGELDNEELYGDNDSHIDGRKDDMSFDKPNIEEDDRDIIRFDAVSDGYSHLFHLPYSKLLEIRDLYSLQSCQHRHSSYGE